MRPWTLAFAMIVAPALLAACDTSVLTLKPATPEPTNACAAVPLIGRLHGDPATPDHVQLMQRDGVVRTLVNPRHEYDFVFDPTLRVVERQRGEVLAGEGDVVELGGEGMLPSGAWSICGAIILHRGGFPPSRTPEPT